MVGILRIIKNLAFFLLFFFFLFKNKREPLGNLISVRDLLAEFENSINDLPPSMEKQKRGRPKKFKNFID